MALGKYSRIDNKRSASSYCSTVSLVVFVALCLVGVWMMTSSSVVPVQNSEVPAEEKKSEPTELKNTMFEDTPGDLPEDATKGDTSSNDKTSNEQENPNPPEKKPESETNDDKDEKIEDIIDEKVVNEEGDKSDNDDKKTDGGDSKPDDEETKNGGEGDTEKKPESDETEKNPDSDETEKKPDSEETEKKPDSDETEKKPNSDETEKKPDSDETEKKPDSDETEKKPDSDETDSESKPDNTSDDQKEENNDSNKIPIKKKEDGEGSEVFLSADQSEILNETSTQNGAFSTQASESRKEKEGQQESKEPSGFSWKLCNVTAGPDYIPCLDNLQAIKNLPTTKHYEHRERHCPDEAPTCLVSLPEGYRRPVEWPTSREKIWYYNIPHTKLAEVKGHQNWVKVSGEYLTFPGGGTQFKHGALHYIDFLQESLPEIAWGKHSRVILDVGCGVASFGGFLFERDVLAMSLAPKDEHEAQVQFALERGIPAISAVMGTKRLPFPGRVFDAVHCARCRVPWHIEGGKLLLELNRVLRPGGFFLWSATPVYQKLDEDVEIWKAMSELTKVMCWKLVTKQKDSVNKVGAALFQKPTDNECYEKRSQNDPPICKDSDDPNASWNVPLQACMHKIPVEATERGSRWPEQWPARLETAPYWLLNSQTGVHGKAAPEDFTADYEHWKRVVTKSYLNGMGISWTSVRNVMDMRAVYGGFAAALRDLNLWVMNIVTIDSPDTLPIIYERGLFGMYHDWCESFSTYPRSYDLLHADHLFSKTKKKCSLAAVVAEVDRMLRPEGKLIVRDNVETINELETLVKAMNWEIRMSFSKAKEGLLCVQKSLWRPTEVVTIESAFA